MANNTSVSSCMFHGDLLYVTPGESQSSTCQILWFVVRHPDHHCRSKNFCDYSTVLSDTSKILYKYHRPILPWILTRCGAHPAWIITPSWPAVHVRALMPCWCHHTKALISRYMLLLRMAVGSNALFSQQYTHLGCMLYVWCAISLWYYTLPSKIFWPISVTDMSSSTVHVIKTINGERKCLCTLYALIHSQMKNYSFQQYHV